MMDPNRSINIRILRKEMLDPAQNSCVQIVFEAKKTWQEGKNDSQLPTSITNSLIWWKINTDTNILMIAIHSPPSLYSTISIQAFTTLENVFQSRLFPYLDPVWPDEPHMVRFGGKRNTSSTLKTIESTIQFFWLHEQPFSLTGKCQSCSSSPNSGSWLVLLGGRFASQPYLGMVSTTLTHQLFERILVVGWGERKEERKKTCLRW